MVNPNLPILSDEEIWDALEQGRDPEARRILGRVAIWDDANKWHHVELAKLATVEFVPASGHPVEQRTRPYITGLPGEWSPSDAPIPVRILRPIVHEDRPAVKVQGLVYGEPPYYFQEAIVDINEAREAGHGFNISPAEQKAA